VILRLVRPFLQTLNKLGNTFTEEDKQSLARLIENNSSKIHKTIDLQEELKEEYKPAVIELGQIDTGQYH
jgi:hypothetical protein